MDLDEMKKFILNNKELAAWGNDLTEERVFKMNGKEVAETYEYMNQILEKKNMNKKVNG